MNYTMRLPPSLKLHYNIIIFYIVLINYNTVSITFSDLLYYVRSMRKRDAYVVQKNKILFLLNMYYIFSCGNT